MPPDAQPSHDTAATPQAEPPPAADRSTPARPTAANDVTGARRPSWTLLAAELRAARAAQGDPSFGHIAAAVSERRRASGVPEHSARVARSTVFDAFRDDRRRVNLPLLREIAAVLGVPDATVDAWVARCYQHASAPRSPDRSAHPPHSTTSATAEVPVGSATGDPATPNLDSHVPALDRPHTDLPLVKDSAPIAWLWLAIACVAVNLAGRVVVDVTGLPLYLDMIGTAVTAIALGPWRGAAVGAATNVLGVVISGPVSLLFAIVNIAGALLWGHGVRRWRAADTLVRFAVLNVAVAAVSTCLAVPILAASSGFSVGHGQDAVTATMATNLHAAVLVATSASNLLTSLVDKTITGFLALVALSAMPAALRAGSPRLPTDPR